MEMLKDELLNQLKDRKILSQITDMIFEVNRVIDDFEKIGVDVLCNENSSFDKMYATCKELLYEILSETIGEITGIKEDSINSELLYEKMMNVYDDVKENSRINEKKETLRARFLEIIADYALETVAS